MSIQEQDRYKVKTVAYHDGGVMTVYFMLIMFDGRGNEVLEGSGYRGEYLGVVKTEGGLHEATTKVRDFANQVEAYDHDTLKNFLLCIEDGTIPWGIIEDGKRYTREEVEELLIEYYYK